MPKRTERLPDDDRTELLGYDELFVEKNRGGRNHYFAWMHDPDVDCCPQCGCPLIKNQNLFSKQYFDIITDRGHRRVISLTYGFYKYRCLNEKCRHVFAKEINFASRSDNVTYRLEKAVAQMVIAGYSYSLIQTHFQDAISRQAVGQIFHRWMEKKEKLRTLQNTPYSIAIISGMIEKNQYTIFLNLDDGIRVIEIILGDNTVDLIPVLRKMRTENVKTVLSDCNPVINDAITDFFPGALHIVPVELWFRTAEAAFRIFAHDKIKGCTVKNKDELIMTPRTELGFRVGDLNRLLNERPEIKPVYEDFTNLRELIERRGELWIYEELIEWADSAEPETKEQMLDTLVYLQAYRAEIEAQTQHRDEVPNRLNDYLSELETTLSQAKISSEETLKARVLYSVETDIQDWRGVPLETVTNTLQNMEIATKRKRRDPYEY